MLDCDGKVHQRCQFRQVDQLVDFLERLPGRFEACFEASCSYGWCYELLKPLASGVAEATWQAMHRLPTVQAYFERIQRGDPARKKIAVTATAHYLVRVIWSMLKNGTLWQENTGEQAA